MTPSVPISLTRRHVRELGLQVLQAQHGLLALGEVADEAGENAPFAEPRFADCELDREGAAVAVQRGRDPADADDLALAGRKIVAQIRSCRSRSGEGISILTFSPNTSASHSRTFWLRRR